MDTSALGAWRPLLQAEFDRPYWAALCAAVDEADRTAEVYPPPAERFAAFALTPPGRVRVILLGQDPYHEPGQAHGLAFSVRESTKLPPSLVNIYKERESDLGIPPSTSGDLRRWAEQGVLLLNTVLTVERGKANSHSRFGWQTFTDAVLRAASALPQPIAAVRARGAAPQSPLRLPRLLRQPPLLADQRLPHRPRRSAHRVVTAQKADTQLSCVSAFFSVRRAYSASGSGAASGGIPGLGGTSASAGRSRTTASQRWMGVPNS